MWLNGRLNKTIYRGMRTHPGELKGPAWCPHKVGSSSVDPRFKDLRALHVDLQHSIV